jgi:ribosome-associated protein
MKETEALALSLARSAIDKKASHVTILDLTQVSSLADYFVIASAMTDRQVRAIAEHLETSLAKEGYRLLSLEGKTESRWVVLDFGDVIAHVFMDALRDYYDLEALWQDAKRVDIPADFYAPVATPVCGAKLSR